MRTIVVRLLPALLGVTLPALVSPDSLARYNHFKIEAPSSCRWLASDSPIHWRCLRREGVQDPIGSTD